MSQFRINYVIATPDEGEDFSPLQGFSLSFLKRRHWIRHILKSCPPTILELVQFSHATLQLRLAGLGSYRIFPLIVPELSKSIVSPDNPFWFVVVDSETKPAVERWAISQEISPCLLDVSSEQDGQNDTFSWQVIRDHCFSTIATLETSFPKWDITLLKRVTREHRPREELHVPLEFAGHNTTIPNELTLMSCGGEFAGESDSLVGDDGVYVQRVLQSADAVAQLRHSVPDSNIFVGAPPMPTLILTCPGAYPHIGKHLSKPRSAEQKRVAEVLKLLQRQSTYAIQLDTEKGQRFRELLDYPEVKDVMGLRSLELSAYTDALSVRSASYLTPVLRVPPASADLKATITRLVDSIRAQRKDGKRARLSQSLFDNLADLIHPEFMKRIDLPHSGVKIISDIPLEWTPVRGLPLMLRHNVSRIPVTPGNLLYINTIPHDQIDLKPSDFGETLVLRAFKEDDPIRGELEHAVATFRLSDGRKIPVRFVDVRNAGQLISTLRSFDGPLAVFDGHGSHTKRDHVAKLHLVDETVNVWELREEVSLPPIFLTCACDTHAIDRSHVSTANGLVNAGARTAIATFLPVLSGQAAIFAARLLFRIYEFLPTATTSFRRAIRWDSVVSLMQRMMFVSEFLRVLESHCKTERKLTLQTEMTGVIHQAGYEWYEQFVERLSAEFGLSVDEIESIRNQHLSIPESVKYVQIGNPETIVIHPEDACLEDYLDNATALTNATQD